MASATIYAKSPGRSVTAVNYCSRAHYRRSRPIDSAIQPRGDDAAFLFARQRHAAAPSDMARQRFCEQAP
jgi:hypothetical protein